MRDFMQQREPEIVQRIALQGKTDNGRFVDEERCAIHFHPHDLGFGYQDDAMFCEQIRNLRWPVFARA